MVGWRSLSIPLVFKPPEGPVPRASEPSGTGFRCPSKHARKPHCSSKYPYEAVALLRE